MRRTTLSMFAQIVQLLPQSLFFKLVQKYQTDKAAKGINTWDQLIAMMFCQLSGAESLREISDGLYQYWQAYPSWRSCRGTLQSFLCEPTP